MYLAVLEDPERMSSRIGHEVRTGAPQNVAGQMIVIPDGDETCVMLFINQQGCCRVKSLDL